MIGNSRSIHRERILCFIDCTAMQWNMATCENRKKIINVRRLRVGRTFARILASIRFMPRSVNAIFRGCSKLNSPSRHIRNPCTIVDKQVDGKRALSLSPLSSFYRSSGRTFKSACIRRSAEGEDSVVSLLLSSLGSRSLTFRGHPCLSSFFIWI